MSLENNTQSAQDYQAVIGAADAFIPGARETEDALPAGRKVKRGKIDRRVQAARQTYHAGPSPIFADGANPCKRKSMSKTQSQRLHAYRLLCNARSTLATRAIDGVVTSIDSVGYSLAAIFAKGSPGAAKISSNFVEYVTFPTLDVQSLAIELKRNGFDASEDQIIVWIENAQNRRAPITPKELGRRLQLTAEERIEARAFNICPLGETTENLAEQRRVKHVELCRKSRSKKDGYVSRQQYEDNSASKTKPWIAAGVSRATWYRTVRQVRDNGDFAFPLCETSTRPPYSTEYYHLPVTDPKLPEAETHTPISAAEAAANSPIGQPFAAVPPAGIRDATGIQRGLPMIETAPTVAANNNDLDQHGKAPEPTCKTPTDDIVSNASSQTPASEDLLGMSAPAATGAVANVDEPEIAATETAAGRKDDVQSPNDSGQVTTPASAAPSAPSFVPMLSDLLTAGQGIGLWTSANIFSDWPATNQRQADVTS